MYVYMNYKKININKKQYRELQDMCLSLLYLTFYYRVSQYTTILCEFKLFRMIIKIF